MKITHDLRVYYTVKHTQFSISPSELPRNDDLINLEERPFRVADSFPFRFVSVKCENIEWLVRQAAAGIYFYVSLVDSEDPGWEGVPRWPISLESATESG